MRWKTVFVIVIWHFLKVAMKNCNYCNYWLAALLSFVKKKKVRVALNMKCRHYIICEYWLVEQL